MKGRYEQITTDVFSELALVIRIKYSCCLLFVFTVQTGMRVDNIIIELRRSYTNDRRAIERSIC